MQNQPAAGTPQRIEVTLQPPPAAGGPVWLGGAASLIWPLVALIDSPCFCPGHCAWPLAGIHSMTDTATPTVRKKSSFICLSSTQTHNE